MTNPILAWTPKGESLDAVLYIARKCHAQAMIDGVDTEFGRIGYVAVTRARHGHSRTAPKDLRCDRARKPVGSKP